VTIFETVRNFASRNSVIG